MSNQRIGIGDRIIVLLLLTAIAYKLLPLALFIALSLAFLFFLTWQQYEDKQHWRRLGIPGPKPNIFFGHTLSRFIKKGAISFDRETYAKYGKTFGSFVFGRHEICTMDEELLKRVLIKDFSHFTNRFNFIGGKSEFAKTNMIRNSMSFIQDEDWKRVRNRVTPAFTTGKLKKLLPILTASSRRLAEFIEKEYISDGKELPIKDLFGRLVLEEIGRAGFSLDLNLFVDETNEFVEQTKKMFSVRNNWRIILMSFCPFTLFYLEKYFSFDAFGSPSITFFAKMMEQLYDQRKADPDAKEKFNDMFQLLINAVDETTGEEEATKVESDEFEHKELELNGTGGQVSKHLSKTELFAQSFLLLIAGYDTTASTLHYAVYLLAKFPDVQDRLREEIENVLGDSEEINYENVKAMYYLQAITRETLRLYPPVPQVNRECKENIDINGVPFQSGDIVTVPVYMMNHSEEYYEEPAKFDPDRFMPGQKEKLDPISFLSFGFGPRNCIGMRLAELQIYTALAALVRRFRFMPGPNTPEFPLKLLSTDMLRPEKPLCVIAERI